MAINCNICKQKVFLIQLKLKFLKHLSYFVERTAQCLISHVTFELIFQFPILTQAAHCDGLDWPAVLRRPWLSRQATGSTLGQFKYLPSCRTRGFPTSANFESKLSVRALMWSVKAERPDPRVSACYLRTKGHQ